MASRAFSLHTGIRLTLFPSGTPGTSTNGTRPRGHTCGEPPTLSLASERAGRHQDLQVAMRKVEEKELQTCIGISYNNHSAPPCNHIRSSPPCALKAPPPHKQAPSYELSALITCFQIAFNTLVESFGVLLNPLTRSTWVTPNLGAKPWFHSRLLTGPAGRISYDSSQLRRGPTLTRADSTLGNPPSLSPPCAPDKVQ
jgi:hypothetical protein